MGVPKLTRLLKTSPVRWNVLLVDPCSLGQVPLASVYQPTPVLGGKAGCKPLFPFTPLFIRSLKVGMMPSAAYLSTRSGRMPSDAKKITLLVSGAFA